MDKHISNLFFLILGINISLITNNNWIASTTISATILTAYALSSKSTLKSIKKHMKKMDATEHLMSTRLFWASVSVPVFASLLLIAKATDWESAKLSFSSDSFNAFIDSFKLPIAIASLAIPLAALVASQHRSIQAAKQIAITSNQNAFNNYIEHRKLFEDFYDRLPNKNKDLVDKNKWLIYQYIFPNAHKDTSEIGEKYFNLTERIKEFSKELNKNAKSELNIIDLKFSFEDQVKSAKKIIIDLEHEINLKEWSGVTKIEKPFRDLKTLLLYLNSLATTFTELAYFCSTIERRESYNELLENTHEYLSWTREFEEIDSEKNQLKFCIGQIRDAIKEGKSINLALNTLYRRSIISKIIDKENKREIFIYVRT